MPRSQKTVAKEAKMWYHMIKIMMNGRVDGMVEHLNYDKMIIAMMKDNEYQGAIKELTEHGFYATILHSTGGFLKRRNVTILVGVSSDRLEDAMELLKKYGERLEHRYDPVRAGTYNAAIASNSVTTPVVCGGIVLFVINVERAERY